MEGQIQQCALAARRLNCILEFIRHGIASQLTKVTVPLYPVLVQPHLEYHVQFGAPQYKDIKPLESMQRRAMKTVKGSRGKTCEEWLVTWFVHPREEETERRPHGSLQLPYEGNGGTGTDLFPLVTETGPEQTV